jgi:hypothetical protein
VGENQRTAQLSTFEEYINLRIIPIMQKQVEIREKEGYRML